MTSSYWPPQKRASPTIPRSRPPLSRDYRNIFPLSRHRTLLAVFSARFMAADLQNIWETEHPEIRSRFSRDHFVAATGGSTPSHCFGAHRYTRLRSFSRQLKSYSGGRFAAICLPRRSCSVPDAFRAQLRWSGSPKYSPAQQFPDHQNVIPLIIFFPKRGALAQRRETPPGRRLPIAPKACRKRSSPPRGVGSRGFSFYRRRDRLPPTQQPGCD